MAARVHKIDGIENIFEKDIDTPFARLSGKIIMGVINGIKMRFLPRHTEAVL